MPSRHPIGKGSKPALIGKTLATGLRFRPWHWGKFCLSHAADGEALGPDVQLYPLLHGIQIDDDAALVLHRQTGHASGQGEPAPTAA